MKIKMIRATGLPVELEHIQEFRAEFKRLYDKAAKVCGKDMLRMQKKLAKIERALQDKFPTLVETDFLATPEAWIQHAGKFGATIVTTHKHTGELVYIIDDLEQQYTTSGAQ